MCIRDSTEDEADQSSVEYQAYLGDLAGASYEGLRQEYLLAKARFRHFSGRFSRRTRFPRRAPWAKGRGKGKGRRSKGRGKGKGFPIGHSFASERMPARALAGGKVTTGNPRDPSGAGSRCFRCASPDHMIADCPKGKGKGSGKKGKGRSYWEEAESWEDDGDLVGQYEFTYMQYTDALYGAMPSPEPQ